MKYGTGAEEYMGNGHIKISCLFNVSQLHVPSVRTEIISHIYSQFQVSFPDTDSPFRLRFPISPESLFAHIPFGIPTLYEWVVQLGLKVDTRERTDYFDRLEGGEGR